MKKKVVSGNLKEHQITARMKAMKPAKSHSSLKAKPPATRKERTATQGPISPDDMDTEYISMDDLAFVFLTEERFVLHEHRFVV